MQLIFNLFSKFIVLTISICVFSNVMAYEEPQYSVIQSNKIYEIRYYDDRLAVQTTYSFDSSGFRKLFNYISGANTKSKKIKMTTPVTESEKIDMTVPVTQTEENQKMVMQFYLPSIYKMNTAPIPADSKVELVNIEKGYFAVMKYSGRLTDKNFNKHKKLLKTKLNEDKIEIISKVIKATYNGPFTLPLFRRNEVMFRIVFDAKN